MGFQFAENKWDSWNQWNHAGHISLFTQNYILQDMLKFLSNGSVKIDDNEWLKRLHQLFISHQYRISSNKRPRRY